MSRAHPKRFEQLVGVGSPRVEIELEATVYENGSGQPLWSNNYLRHQESSVGDRHTTAAAMQAALANIFLSMVKDPATMGPPP